MTKDSPRTPQSETKDYFRIDLSKLQFDRLKRDRKFILIMQLARYMNQLAFVWSELNIVVIEQTHSPVQTRQIANRFLFTAGILHEMLQWLPTLSAEFRGYDAYKEGFEKLWVGNRNTVRMKEKVLNRLRNGVVYHIDREAIEETLDWVEFDEYVFLRAEEESINGMHFQLADDLAYNYMTGCITDDDRQRQTFEKLFAGLGELTADFNRSALTLVLAYAEEQGWKVSAPLTFDLTRQAPHSRST